MSSLFRSPQRQSVPRKHRTPVRRCPVGAVALAHQAHCLMAVCHVHKAACPPEGFGNLPHAGPVGIAQPWPGLGPLHGLPCLYKGTGSCLQEPVFLLLSPGQYLRGSPDSKAQAFCGTVGGKCPAPVVQNLVQGKPCLVAGGVHGLHGLFYHGPAVLGIAGKDALHIVPAA